MKNQISDERIQQILNNVSEEYLEDDLTDFATKTELCEVILWLKWQSRKDNQIFQSKINNIITICLNPNFKS